MRVGKAASILPILFIGFVAGFLAASYLRTPSTQTQPTTSVSLRAALAALTDREYFTELKNFLTRANMSIYVIMYVIKYDPNEPEDPVNQLLKTLVELKKKGLDVRIVVDDTTYKDYPQTISYLKNNGVPIKLDESPAITTHAKLVIIDNKTVIVGSHNWTESALTRNRETSIMVQDRETATKLVEYFIKIWNGGRSI